ncbi:MAG TPA: class I SAM-dependent methyltransferase [Myxococcaceae bacterium]|nr:class I SAM-dependent methyltransferase [Myxococcaceae bacterium]
MASWKERLLGAAKSLAYKALPPPTSNFEYNRRLWNRYARFWWLTRSFLKPYQTNGQGPAGSVALQTLGDEWGNHSDIECILADYVYPFVDSQSVVAEVGSGGGRIALRVAPRVREYDCLDISQQMLKKAQIALAGQSNIRFILLEKPRFPLEDDAVDFVLAFDVFVHLDLHLMWKYFQEIRRVLKPGGHAFLHTTNLKAPGGWEAFSRQDSFRVEDHYFITPETVAVLAKHARLRIVKESADDPRNFYLHRDYLFVVARD